MVNRVKCEQSLNQWNQKKSQLIVIFHLKNVLKVTFLANVLTSLRLFHLSDKRLGIIALLVEYRIQEIFAVESGIQGF